MESAFRGIYTIISTPVFRAAFQILANAIQIPVTDPLQFNPKFTSAPTSDSHRPNAQTHPKVRFWNKVDYLDWLDSVEATSGDRGKLPFLEDENGNSISEAMVEAIRKSLWGAWSELATRNLAPSSWGKLSASGTQLVNTIMDNVHPIFKLAHNNWKLDFLATSSYSSWQRNHLDDFGNYRKAKKNDNDNDIDATNVIPPLTPASSSTCEVLSPPNGVSSSPLLQTLSLEGQSLQCNQEPPQRDQQPPQHNQQPPPHNHEPPQHNHEPLQHDHKPPQCDHKPPQNLVQAVEKDLEATPEIAAPPVLVPEVVPVLQSPFKQQVPAHRSPTRSLEDKENPSNIPVPKPIKVVNPLTALATAAAQISFSPLPPILESAPTNTSSDSAKASTSKATKTGGKAKMRPSPTRNRCNLCALRWLKQLKTNGTMEEFCTYYTNLTPEQHKKYNDEAAKLVADNTWTKGVCEGLVY
ncbi:uncharacterized protein F5147DRAFT_660407 [Suillus discolor]|uniref:Uncharacterized protein n=1 Tax=Suillus discolor TaxID=1912936 RepID=A0A9P7ERG2_9AGAM|nr:uncharacterized protein F5147DRAFT_660407 [Suillus discolor]KAG2082731.1 hypothetical protein F5147DRAFT_660407 [Suillus discolor]